MDAVDAARRYNVDGVRFDLLGHIPLKVMRKAAFAGVDGLNIILQYIMFIWSYDVNAYYIYIMCFKWTKWMI